MNTDKTIKSNPSSKIIGPDTKKPTELERPLIENLLKHDKNHDGKITKEDGYSYSYEDYAKKAKEAHEDLNEKAIRRCFEAQDMNKDGTLDWSDFDHNHDGQITREDLSWISPDGTHGKELSDLPTDVYFPLINLPEKDQG